MAEKKKAGAATVPTVEELEKKAAEEKAALDVALVDNAAAAGASSDAETADLGDAKRHADGSPFQLPGARKVPTLDEVIAAGYSPEAAAQIVEDQTTKAKAEAEVAAASDGPIEPLPETAPEVPAPRPRHRVRVEEFFYWRQGPGLPGVPVNAGDELVLEGAEIDAIVAQGARLTLLGENFRARAIAIIERLPSHMRDPAPLSGGLAELEKQLAQLVDQILAFEASKGIGG